MANFVKRVFIILILIGIPLFTTYHLQYFAYQEITLPTSTQRIYFIALSFFEALSVEIGLISLFLVLPVVRKMEKRLRSPFIMVYFPLLWLLMSWWPHDYFHLHNGNGTWGLIIIEYGFHFTSMIAAGVSIYGLSNLIQYFLERPQEESL